MPATTRTLAATGLALLALGVAAERSSADPYGAGIFSASGSGIASVEDDGDVVFSGPGSVSDRRLQDLLDATVTVVVSPDGALPDAGSCIPADATVVTEGKRGAGLTLAADGQICTRVVFGTFTETVFDGTFDVVDAQRPDLRGTSGTLRIGLKPNGWSYFSAASQVPA